MKLRYVPLIVVAIVGFLLLDGLFAMAPLLAYLGGYVTWKLAILWAILWAGVLAGSGGTAET